MTKHCPSHYTFKQRIAFHTAATNANGCRLWLAGVSEWGYPQLKYKGRNRSITRYLLAVKLGRAMRPGTEACHTCDVKACVNPGHLFEGTKRDNMQDMVRKDRSARGERQGQSKLTDKQVRQI